MSAISVSGITKRFGKRTVLDGISLEIREGEAYALLGGNGAGKTTLIRMMAGLLEPDAGEVRVLGTNPLTSTTGFVPGVAFVSERRGVYQWLTVGEAIDFAREITPGWIPTEEETLVRRLRLDLKAVVGDLSRGEIGKLCLLTALASRPKVLIMDEPTAGLDPLVRRTFLEEVVTMMLEEGRTVLYSTHELYEAERIAQRVGILFDGRLILESGVDELRSSHRTVTAALPEQAKSAGRLNGANGRAERETADALQNPTPPGTQNSSDTSCSLAGPDLSALPGLGNLPGLMSARKTGGRLFMDFSGWTDETESALASSGLSGIEILPVNLEDIFCMYGEKEVVK